MKSGYRVIKELGKLGLRGYFFSYIEYKELAQIENFMDVKDRIIKWGYPEVKYANTEKEIVLKMKESEHKKDKKNLFHAILEPVFWLFLLLLGGC
jgi:hypothetical protein